MAETIEVTATQNQAIVAIGEEEACVNIGTRFWNLTNGQERGAVVPYRDPKKSLGVLAPANVLPAIQKAITAMNTDSRFMVLFRLARTGDKHILEFKHEEPPASENWSAYSDAAGIMCNCHITPGSCNAKVQKVVVSKSATKGHVIHELMHVLGFEHEHQLKDRDIFVSVDEDQAKNDPTNYAATAERVPRLEPTAPKFFYYDPLSIMHYPLCERLGIQSTKMLDEYLTYLATHVFTNKTEAEIRESIGKCEKLSARDAKGVGCLYGPHKVANVCTFAAFLDDNMCEHASYCLPTAKDQKMCKFCVDNCYTGEKFEESEGPRGFVCACKNKEQHVQEKYETIGHLYR